MNFFQALTQRRIYLDGAMGSELIARGFPSTEAEIVNITHPEVVTAIHRSYVEAGSDAVYTNTFGANSLKLKGYSVEEIVKAAVDNAKASGARWVGYDCGPLGTLLYPYGELTVETAYGLFAEQAKAVENSGADFVVIETIGDTMEMKCAVTAFKDNCTLPIICSMTFEKNGRSFVGSSVAAFAITAQALGVSAIGVNCGTGAADAYDNVKDLIAYAHIPVFAKPNAGLPRYVGGKTIYDATPATYGEAMKKIAMLGVTALGGCCGTNPQYIKEMIQATSSVGAVIHSNRADAVCSGRKVVRLLRGSIIGERLNPTGKPRLKQALLNDDYDYMLGICTSQVDKGADILDVNAGVAGVDESAKLPEIIRRIQSVTDAPVQIDSGKAAAISAALKAVDGVPIINSVNGDESSLNAILPLAAKYGAYLVALCLDEKGIPSTVEGRVAIAERIAERANVYGIPKERLLVDALTMAVSVDKNNGLITLATVKELTERGFKTVLGLSNVSFGLPARELLNSAFYGMAQKAGLTAAILNPSMKEIAAEDLPYALAVLNGEDEKAESYIARYAGYKAPEAVLAELTPEECILRGLRDEGVAAVKRLCNEDNYNRIIQDNIIKGLNELGDRYEKGVAFLPQLMGGAESAKAMLAYIKDSYMRETENGVVTLLATVKGDVHDIGKNIVKAVLGNYGYRVIDLGKSVDTAALVAAVEKYKPQVVGLSALMTTTLDNMKESVAELKTRYPELIVSVGGAVVTPEFAESIGALYSEDANRCVKVLDKALNR